MENESTEIEFENFRIVHIFLVDLNLSCFNRTFYILDVPHKLTHVKREDMIYSYNTITSLRLGDILFSTEEYETFYCLVGFTDIYYINVMTDKIYNQIDDIAKLFPNSLIHLYVTYDKPNLLLIESLNSKIKRYKKFFDFISIPKKQIILM